MCELVRGILIAVLKELWWPRVVAVMNYDV